MHLWTCTKSNTSEESDNIQGICTNEKEKSSYFAMENICNKSHLTFARKNGKYQLRSTAHLWLLHWGSLTFKSFGRSRDGCSCLYRQVRPHWAAFTTCYLSLPGHDTASEGLETLLLNPLDPESQRQKQSPKKEAQSSLTSFLKWLVCSPTQPTG